MSVTVVWSEIRPVNSTPDTIVETRDRMVKVGHKINGATKLLKLTVLPPCQISHTVRLQKLGFSVISTVRIKLALGLRFGLVSAIRCVRCGFQCGPMR